MLDFGATETGRSVARAFASHMSNAGGVKLIDEDQTRAAARGAGYEGSLNMTVEEARDLAASIGCDFFITGDAQTVRRTSSAAPVYFEAYASVFVVSSRTGRLIFWERESAEAATEEEAENLLQAKLQVTAWSVREILPRAAEEELARRAREAASEVLQMEELPEEDSPAAASFRPPHPYKRVRPLYTDAAARAEAEATVDASVEIDERGEVLGAEIVRWAGFGLDESVLETIRGLRFRPAMREGRPVAVRVLLRYNFRRPPRRNERVREGEKKLAPAFKALIKKELPAP